jgi:hypothetical protein
MGPCERGHAQGRDDERTRAGTVQHEVMQGGEGGRRFPKAHASEKSCPVVAYEKIFGDFLIWFEGYHGEATVMR